MRLAVGHLQPSRLARRALDASSASFTALVVTMVALGLLMFTSGLRRLATNLIRGAANEANAPLPYTQRFNEWASLLRTPQSTEPWSLLIVATSPFQEACDRAGAALAHERTWVKTTVIAPVDLGQPPDGADCSGDGYQAVTLGASRRHVLLPAATAHRSGFSLFNRDLVPVYGSRRLDDLDRVPAVLHIWMPNPQDSANAGPGQARPTP